MTPEARAAYDRALDWMYASLNERGHLGRGLGDSARRHPTWTRALLDALGAPDADVPALLVVGSKGKGSTSAMAAAALAAARRGPVGLSTSPHLVDVRERVRLDLVAIGADELTRRLVAMQPAADALRLAMPSPAYQSPVGLMAVAGAMHFAARRAAFAVYEAGRGGRVDDVAEVMHQVVAATPILLEHRAELGPDLVDIARHKAGGIRAGTRVVVSGSLVAVAATVFARAARSVGAAHWRLGHELRLERLGPDPAGRERVRVATPGRTYAFTVPLPGPHQADNAAVAVGAAEALAGRPLDGAALVFSLDRLRWPGRLETVRTEPGGGPVLLDGAIEPDAVARTLQHAHAHLPPPYAVVVGAGTDKRPLRLWQAAAALADWTVVTRAHAPHLHFPPDAEAEAWAAEAPLSRAAMPELQDALGEARSRAGRAGTVVVVGTLSLVGEALHLLGQDTADLVRAPSRTSP